MTATERGDWLDHAATCETCRAIANTLPTDGPAIPPATVGRFVPTREIGRGAMGVVYAADDPELGRTVALKLLHDAADGERLHREARSLAMLAHENVVRVYELGVDDGRVWVAMELVEGVTLRSWLAAAPRSQGEILALVLRAGHGLAAAHAAGIVHRDFKPDNVFVGGDRVVVGDFGLSRLGANPGGAGDDRTLGSDANDKLTRTGAAVGTPAYMAPEQITGEATPLSDQFAFCVTAWEALFGVRPFHGATLRELREAVLQGYFTRPSRAIPRRVERALRRGLSGVPADRFPSMAELLAALVPPRRTRWLATGALAAVATTSGIAYALVDRAADPCEIAGAAIFDVWTDAQRHRVAAHDPVMEKLIDDYARSWQAARTEACRRPSTMSQRAVRESCLERARAELANQLPTLDDLPTKLLPIASCEGELALPKTPGYEVDARGCGCPYSACTDDRVCLSQCNARAFRSSGPVPGISVAGQQEAIVGASGDGTTLLYLAGKGCRLDHLYLARRDGERYVPVDLTPELAKHGMEPFEGCCTLASDARSLIVSHRHRVGLVRFSLVDDTLVAPDTHEFGEITPDATATQRIWSPVISADQRSLYFVLVDITSGPIGPHEAHRDSVARPFAAATRMTGRPGLYEGISGISADGLTLFMTTEFMTSVLLRDSTSAPFGDLGIGKPPARLPGWRAIPIENCRRIVTTMSPGGCRQEDMVFLDAIGP